MNVAQRPTAHAEPDQDFALWVSSTIGGDRLKRCIQCGQCSAICPLASYMDYTPRQVMRLAREGFKEEALSSNSIWLCASCYGCTVECPKDIKITDVMYHLKQKAIRDKVAPRGFPTPVLVRSFSDMVRSRGRVSESWLMMRVLLGTNLLKVFGMTRLGLGLLRTGRFKIKRESVRNRADLQKLLAAVQENRGKEVANR